MKILNGQQAFEALGKGKKVLCREINKSDEFQPICNFGATVYFDSGYEFTLKVEMLNLGGIEFKAPLELSDLAQGQEFFIVSPTCIHYANFDSSNPLHLDSIRNGFAQETETDAKLQMTAICALFGRSVHYPAVRPLDEKPKRSSKKQKSEDAPAETNVIIEVPKPELDLQTDVSVEPKNIEIGDSEVQKFLGAIDKCTSDYELQGVELNLNGHKDKFHPNTVEILKQRISEKRESLNEVKKINACNSKDELYQLNQAVVANDKLNIDQQEQLVEPSHQKAEEFAPDAKTEVEQPSLIDLVEDQAKNAIQDKIYKDAMSGNGQASYPIDMLYTQKKQMLISRIQEMDSIEALERIAPAIPAAKLNPEDHQELLQIYAERKTAMQHADA